MSDRTPADELTAAPGEHPMAWALRCGAAPIPEDTKGEICEASNCGLPTGWPEFEDSDSDVWFLTGEVHDGDRVMMPAAGDMDAMLRRDVERFFGPLHPAAGEGR